MKFNQFESGAMQPCSMWSFSLTVTNQYNSIEEFTVQARPSNFVVSTRCFHQGNNIKYYMKALDVIKAIHTCIY